MVRTDLQNKKIPDLPGVYFFLGKKKEILYIGKATSLKNRVRSYFDLELRDKRSVLIEKMVLEARQIEWVVTDSVIEALLLEVNLIRTHKPVYNTRSKDDKSYNHVVITKETYPQVLVVRGKDLVDSEREYSKVYGPFPSGTEFKTALKILRKIFQFYDVRIDEVKQHKMLRGKIDFNRQIGLYPEACTPEEYKKRIRHIILFFEGKKIQIVKELEKDMMRYAKKFAFEKAEVTKKQIFALKHIHDIALIRDDARIYKDDRRMRIEAYDVAHLQGDNMVGVMIALVGDEPDKSAYRKFHIRNFTKANDPGALREVLIRRFLHTEWQFPDLIVVDGSTAQKNVALQVLKSHKLVIPVVGVVKDEKHNPKRMIGPLKSIKGHTQAILLANAEAHRFAITFHKNVRKKAFLGGH